MNVDKNVEEINFSASEKLFRSPCEFIMSVVRLADLPAPQLPEIAFAGRSNVGKSSIINGLLNNKNMARASNTPGRTQALNYFNLNNRIMLVDMPGYGYAEAPKKLVDSWKAMMREFVLGRVPLKRVYTLIDARHGIKKVDREFMALMDKSAMSYQIILTKADKVSENKLHLLKTQIENDLIKHPAAYPEVIYTSSEKKKNLEFLRFEIAKFAEEER